MSHHRPVLTGKDVTLPHCRCSDVIYDVKWNTSSSVSSDVTQTIIRRSSTGLYSRSTIIFKPTSYLSAVAFSVFCGYSGVPESSEIHSGVLGPVGRWSTAMISSVLVPCRGLMELPFLLIRVLLFWSLAHVLVPPISLRSTRSTSVGGANMMFIPEFDQLQMFNIDLNSWQT